MSHNTWLHRASRVILVKPLLATQVTPNQLTTARLIAGCTAAFFIAIGDQLLQDIGAGIFVFAMVLDRVDGDLARLSGQTSDFGHTYDLLSDAICNIIIFIGLGIGLRSSGFGFAAIPMGLVAGIAVGIIFVLVIRIEHRRGVREGELESFAGFDIDDVIIVVPISLWFRAAEELLLAACIFAPLFSIYFYYLYRKKMECSRIPND